MYLSLAFSLSFVVLPLLAFTVANLGGALENINEVDARDSPISIIYENLDISHDKPLEINGFNPSFILLSDSYGSRGGTVESGNDPLSYFKGDADGSSCNPIYMEVVSCNASYL